jgi:hypothetical protein
MNGYPDRSAMGFIQPKRIQVKLLEPDLALALTWWSVAFPTSRQNVGGISRSISAAELLSPPALCICCTSSAYLN